MSEAAQKAHEAMIEIVTSTENLHSTYIESESRRRKADSRTKKLATALQSSTEGMEAWKTAIEEGFELQNKTTHELMSLARNIAEGGRSTAALSNEAKKSRIQSNKSDAKQKRGE